MQAVVKVQDTANGLSHIQSRTTVSNETCGITDPRVGHRLWWPQQTGKLANTGSLASTSCVHAPHASKVDDCKPYKNTLPMRLGHWRTGGPGNYPT